MRAYPLQTIGFAIRIGIAAAIAGSAGVAAAQQASHVVGIGIGPIVALAVESDGSPLGPEGARTDRFHVTSNRDRARLVARLDRDLPPGVRLFVSAETDLVADPGERSVSSGRETILATRVARGVRKAQVLRLRVEGRADQTVRRTLSVGLVDPETGRASWQAVPVEIPAN